MKNLHEIFQIIITSIGGVIGYGLGGNDGFLYALILLIFLDYITGILIAILEKRLSSEVGFKGIFKKVFIFILVAVAHVIDTHLIGESSVIRTAVIFFYASNEGISILENASKLGLPIPFKLKEVLKQIGDDNSENL